PKKPETRSLDKLVWTAKPYRYLTLHHPLLFILIYLPCIYLSQIWFQNKRQSSRRIPKPTIINKGSFAPLKPAAIEPLKSSISNIQNITNTGVRVPLSTKTNHAPLSPMTKNIQKPSLETTCMSSYVPRRAQLKRTPSIR